MKKLKDWCWKTEDSSEKAIGGENRTNREKIVSLEKGLNENMVATLREI
jgi:hypothetical protein